MRQLYFLFICILLNIPAVAQSKFEKEVRINEADVPVSCKEALEKFKFRKRIKWYREYGLTETTLEAKTKRKRKRYSIEFDNECRFQDMEIEIKRKEVPDQIMDSISTLLQKKYKSYKIKKIQLQLTDPIDSLLQSFHATDKIQSLPGNYELVVQAKENGDYKSYELLFNYEGQLLKTAEIIERNLDIIEY